MKQPSPDPFASLTASAACVERAAQTTAWLEESTLKALAAEAEGHQRTLYQALQVMFITPMERGDLYLPACLCVRQLRLLADEPPGFGIFEGLLRCAQAQKKLLSLLSGFETPAPIHTQCRVLRKAAAAARTQKQATRPPVRLVDSFFEMADLVEYLLLKNN